MLLNNVRTAKEKSTGPSNSEKNSSWKKNKKMEDAFKFLGFETWFQRLLPLVSGRIWIGYDICVFIQKQRPRPQPQQQKLANKKNNLWFETKLARADSKSLNKNIRTQENKNIKKTHVTYPYIFQHPHSHNLCWIAVEFFVFSALLLTARWRRDRETQCMTARRGIYQWFCPHALGKYPKLQNPQKETNPS